MDIEAYIKIEAPNKDAHDTAYATTLRGSYNVHKDKPLAELKEWLSIARSRYDSTHNSTADCMILFALIKENKNGSNSEVT